VPLLELHDVVAGYGPVPTLDGLTLAVDAGTVVAVVGRNGAGKTTLLRAAAGLLRPRRGRVTVDGHDLATLSVRAAARLVSGVPQDDAVEAPFRVREIVALGRLAHVSPWRGRRGRRRRRRRRARGHRPRRARGPARGRFSGGERRRVAVARCLAQGARSSSSTSRRPISTSAGGRLLAVVRRLAREREPRGRRRAPRRQPAAAFADRVLLLARAASSPTARPPTS
jgi:iron complex transport system ATP-binding protein